MTEIAKAYGDTLYALAAECEAEDEMLEQLAVLQQVCTENPQFLSLLSAPTLKKEERVAIVDEVFSGKLHIYLFHFLKVLIENNAVPVFMDAAKQFRRAYDEAHGIETVTVTSAIALTSAQEAELAEKLGRVTGKTIRLETQVDPSVMGGVRLQMDGIRMDGTVKNKLDAIRSKLLHTIA